MPTFRLTIERTVRFQLDIEAADRMHALKILHAAALDYDDRDLKETHVIAIKELEKVAVQHPFD